MARLPAALTAWMRCGSGGTYDCTSVTASFMAAVISAFFFATILPFTPPGADSSGGAVSCCFWTFPSGP